MGIQQVKCSGKTKQAVVMRWMFLLVGWRNGAAASVMLAKLGKRQFVKSGSLGQLGANDRNQQRLHDKRIDGSRANQPSPETPQSQTRLIWPGSHAHELMLMPRGLLTN